MDSMPYAALVMNYSKDFAAPDQAAAVSAIATGERVNNRAIAINGEGKPIKSIIELAREYGRATGLVTDTKLTDATNAAFYAHTGDPNDPEKIAAEFVDRGNIDIAMGGGAAQFIPATKGGERQDTRDLLLELVATDSTSSAHARIWKRFQRGAGRNFSASSATTISRSQIRWKSEASSPVFRTW